MLPPVRRSALSLLTLLLLALPVLAQAQAADPDPGRFGEAITRFQRWDAQNAWPSPGIVFVGSSSIVYWPTRERFPDLPVINRGFGGSHISDVNHFVDETVLKYSPELVVFYAGNNDIAAGKTAEQVLADYQRFVGTTLLRVPEAQILFVSIHPSILRWQRWPEMHRANEMIREWSENDRALHFVDISQAMLGADGEPQQHLFVQDNLHLSPAGYDVWTPLVREAIERIRSPASTRR
jgi:lysophospholipase L1-like esterase